jgi:hypothetical protein
MNFQVPKNLVQYLCTGKREDLKTVTYRDETKKEMLNAGATSQTGMKKEELQRTILNRRQS